MYIKNISPLLSFRSHESKAARYATNQNEATDKATSEAASEAIEGDRRMR